MPIDISASADLIRIRFQGAISAAELLQHARDLARMEGKSAVSLNRFTDLSESTALPHFMEMADFAARRTEAALKNPVRSAVYAANEFQFGMARMFEKLNANPNIELRIFSDKAEALAWLAADDWEGTEGGGNGAGKR